MRLIVTALAFLMLSTGVFCQAFDEEETAPAEKKEAPKPVVVDKKTEPAKPVVKPVEVPKPAAPVTAPAVVPAATPAAVPATTPAAAPATTPAVAPATTPAAVPAATPAVVPATAPAVAPAAPVAAPVAAPAAAPVTPEAKTAQPVAAPEAPAEVLFSSKFERPTDTVCAVTGTTIQVTDATPYSDYSGVRYYFVDEAKKKDFEKNAWKYVKDIMTCQVCGKQDKKRGRGRATFAESKYEGKSYWFCSNAHKAEFEAEPMKFIDPDKLYISSKKKKLPPPPPPPVKRPAKTVTTEKALVTPEKSLKAMTEATPEKIAVTAEPAAKPAQETTKAK